MFSSISSTSVAAEQIPLEIRLCFVRAILLLTRYPQLGGKQTEGTYNSPIVSSYQCDRIPDAWYENDAAIKLCQLFALPNFSAQELQALITRADQEIDQQQTIIDALINNFDRLGTQKDALNLFQALFGDIPIPEASIKCLTTKMQITFIVDYEGNRLQSANAWSNLSKIEQEQISKFLEQVSQFSFKQFANFPSFNCLELEKNNLRLWRYLTEVTGYNQSEINQAIASSVNIISANNAESFLHHDLWGHYWQSILTQFGNDYVYLSQVDRDLDINSSIDTSQGEICLGQLFKLQNQSISVDVPLAKQFFHCMATRRINALSTHLIGEILADINEYKWLSQNRDRQALLNSSSSFPDSPTKLDLTIKDWDFLYLPTLETLIKFSPALEADLIEYFKIKNNKDIDCLRIALSNLHHIFLTEYINQYQLPVRSDRYFGNPISNLTTLQSTLNDLYTKPVDKDSIPFQDLILLFVGNYYSVESKRDITQVNFALRKYFFACHQLLSQVSDCLK